MSTLERLHGKLARMRELLDEYETGFAERLPEDRRSHLIKDVTAEHVASMRREIDTLERLLTDMGTVPKPRGP